MYVKNHHDVLPPQLVVNNANLSSRPLKSSIWEKLLMCFRLVDNYAAVISLDNSNRNSMFLTMMAGMRTIICLWITVFHVYYYSLFAMSNTPFIFAKLEKLALQPIMQACFYVDVFFVMRWVSLFLFQFVCLPPRELCFFALQFFPLGLQFHVKHQTTGENSIWQHTDKCEYVYAIPVAALLAVSDCSIALVNWVVVVCRFFGSRYYD